MGVSTFAHPCCQAFALPLPKDKKRSQPTPSDIIYLEYNTPTQTFRCITSVGSSKLRGLTTQNSNVRKRLPLGCPYKRYPQPQDSIKIFDLPYRKRLV